jgi:hypothetical protein
MAWKLLISSLSINTLLRTSQFKNNQQKVLYALVRFVKFKSLLCWERNPFFGTSWIFWAWWSALGQVLISRKSLKRIPYPLKSSLKDPGWIWYSDIRSAQFLHTSRKERNIKRPWENCFFILKTKTRRKKRTYSYKENTFQNIIFFLENRRCFSWSGVNLGF